MPCGRSIHTARPGHDPHAARRTVVRAPGFRYRVRLGIAPGGVRHRQRRAHARWRRRRLPVGTHYRQERLRPGRLPGHLGRGLRRRRAAPATVAAAPQAAGMAGSAGEHGRRAAVAAVPIDQPGRRLPDGNGGRVLGAGGGGGDHRAHAADAGRPVRGRAGHRLGAAHHRRQWSPDPAALRTHPGRAAVPLPGPRLRRLSRHARGAVRRPPAHAGRARRPRRSAGRQRRRPGADYSPGEVLLRRHPAGHLDLRAGRRRGAVPLRRLLSVGAQVSALARRRAGRHPRDVRRRRLPARGQARFRCARHQASA